MSNFCVFRCSTKFPRKHLCLSLFLINLQVFMLKLYWKKRLGWRCFLMNFARCLRQFFYRTLPGDCLCSTEKYFTNKIVKSPLKKKKWKQLVRKATICAEKNWTQYLHQIFLFFYYSKTSWFLFSCFPQYIESMSF